MFVLINEGSAAGKMLYVKQLLENSGVAQSFHCSRRGLHFTAKIRTIYCYRMINNGWWWLVYFFATKKVYKAFYTAKWIKRFPVFWNYFSIVAPELKKIPACLIHFRGFLSQTFCTWNSHLGGVNLLFLVIVLGLLGRRWMSEQRERRLCSKFPLYKHCGKYAVVQCPNLIILKVLGAAPKRGSVHSKHLEVVIISLAEMIWMPSRWYW